MLSYDILSCAYIKQWLKLSMSVLEQSFVNSFKGSAVVAMNKVYDTLSYFKGFRQMFVVIIFSLI